jgi:hypothetical protein
MMMTPHSTDIDMPPVILLTRAIQQKLNTLGANIAVSGAIDQPTDDILVRLCGDGYLTRPWYMICEAVVSANRRGVQVQRERMDLGVPAQPLNGFVDNVGDTMASMTGMEIPGGGYTYLAAGAGLLYYLFKGKKR